MAAKNFQGLFSPLEVVSTNNLLRIQQDQCKIQMTRVYYSIVFKLFYSAVIFFSVLCIGITVLELIYTTQLLLIVEGVVTVMLVFETVYRGIMQGWRNYVGQRWNLLDIIIVLSSIALLWLGIETGGGIGEIDTVSAVTIIVLRSIIQFIRLLSLIRKKQGQDVQIIDLNDMSEADEIGNTGKQKYNKANTLAMHKIEEENKKEYQESQVEV